MCIDCSDTLTIATTPGSDGLDGASAFVYIASADNSSGLNFTYPQNNTQNYIAVKSTTTVLSPPVVSDFTSLWRKIQGVDGTNGTDGIFGGVSFEYSFGATAFVGNPGTGFVNLNNVSASAATIMSISNLEINGVDISATIAAMLASTSTNKGFVKLTKKADSSKFMTFSVQALVQAAYSTLTITNLSYSTVTPFVQGDSVIFTLSLTGDKGTTGGSGTNGNDGKGYLATSTSSLLISLASKSVSTQANLAYSAGARIRMTNFSSGNYMEGVVTSYSGTTLVFTADYAPITGSTYNAWNINLAGDPGATSSTTQGTAGGFLAIITSDTQPVFSITTGASGVSVDRGTIKFINDTSNGGFDNGNNYNISRYVVPVGGYIGTMKVSALTFSLLALALGTPPDDITFIVKIIKNRTTVGTGTVLATSSSAFFDQTSTVGDITFIADFDTGAITLSAAEYVEAVLYCSRSSSADVTGAFEIRTGVLNN